MILHEEEQLHGGGKASVTSSHLRMGIWEELVSEWQLQEKQMGSQCLVEDSTG